MGWCLSASSALIRNSQGGLRDFKVLDALKVFPEPGILFWVNRSDAGTSLVECGACFLPPLGEFCTFVNC